MALGWRRHRRSPHSARTSPSSVAARPGRALHRLASGRRRGGGDGGNIHRRPLVAGLGVQVGRRGAGPLPKAGCARQQRRRDVRNTAADEGWHRTDLGGQPPGAVSAQQAPPPPAEGERAGPHHHHGFQRRIGVHAFRSTISTPSAPIGALAATAKLSWPTSCSRPNWRDVSMGLG
jgi:hypothetical protein